jgi:L-ribulose-5-phosphate 4-epimerase
MIDSLQNICFIANLQLPQLGLVDLTFGNLSVSDPQRGLFAIKPSGIPYESLKVEDIVLVDYEGLIISKNKLRPSSDTPTHRRLYLAFPKIRSIVHTHSRHAVAFAQAGLAIPCLGTTHADHFYGNIPVTRSLTPAEIQGDYEWETGNVIAETFQNIPYSQIPAVLVRNHGPFTWAESSAQALENALALEIAAQMARETLLLNPHASVISPVLLDKHYLRKHGANAYYGQPILE